MTIFRSTVPLTSPVPGHLTIPQFLLDDFEHPTRPKRASTTPCLIDDDTGELIFLEDLRRRTQYLAASLYHTYGIKHDDVVGIMSPNHIDFGPCAWATHRVGGVVATISPTLTLSELSHSIRLTEPVLFIVHSDCLPVVLEAISSTGTILSLDRIIVFDSLPVGDAISSESEQDIMATHSFSYKGLRDIIDEGSRLPPAVERVLQGEEGEHALAFLAPSSGTTGMPKAVCITHRNVISMIIQEATWNRLNETYAPSGEQRFRPGDVGAGFLPLYHIYGLVFNLHFMLYASMTLVLAPKFRFESFLSSIQRYQITHLSLVPPQAVLLCKHPATRTFNLSSVRYCIVAAAPLSASLTEEILAVLPGIDLGQGYGMTETCGAASMFPVSQKVGVLGSGGQLLPGTEAKLIKADGSMAGEGEEGELYIRGGQITSGYYRNRDATAEVLNRDGWLRTGDSVIITNNELFIVDRVKELIKVRTHQVAPAELEGHILKHTCVADVAVIGIADDYSGELPFAFVVLKSQVAISIREDRSLAYKLKFEIQKHVAKSMSRVKWLDGGVAFVDNIPKTGSGKILRRELRLESQKYGTSRRRWQLRSRM